MVGRCNLSGAEHNYSNGFHTSTMIVRHGDGNAGMPLSLIYDQNCERIPATKKIKQKNQ